jgi:DNA-binding response OmpR family regulator
MVTTVLVIGHDHELAAGFVQTLESGGHVVELAWDAGVALDRIRLTPAPDLVIVDLALPRTSGFQLVHDVRREGNEIPIVAIGVREDEAERVQCFRLGADQHVHHNVGALELMVRVDALLERSRARGWASVDLPSRVAFRFGDIEVNAATREVHRDGRQVVLAPLELELLLALIRRRGATAARMELLREVWGYESDVVSRTLDTHVANLRGKLERDPATPRHILTVRKTGYRLQA